MDTKFNVAVIGDTNSEYLSPLHNFLINASRTKINGNSTFILSIWINGCYSKYPVNIASMKYIRTYYFNGFKISQLIDHNFPSQIINILNENNNKFRLLYHGYIRKFNTKYIIPKDVM
eukprot:486548_1